MSHESLLSSRYTNYPDPVGMLQFFRRLGNSVDDALDNAQKCQVLNIESVEDFYLEIIKDKGFLDILNLSLIELDNISKLSGISFTRSGQELSEHTFCDRTQYTPYTSAQDILSIDDELSSDIENRDVDEFSCESYSQSSYTGPHWINPSENNEIHEDESEGSQSNLFPNNLQEITHWDNLCSSHSLQVFNDKKSLRCDSNNLFYASIFLECPMQVTLMTIRINREDYGNMSGDKVLMFGVLSETDVDEVFLQFSHPFTRDIWEGVDSRHLKYTSDGYRHYCRVVGSDGAIDSVLPTAFDNDIELSLIVNRTSETCSFLWNDRVKYIFQIPWGIPSIGLSISPGFVVTLVTDAEKLINIWRNSPIPNMSNLFSERYNQESGLISNIADEGRLAFNEDRLWESERNESWEIEQYYNEDGQNEEILDSDDGDEELLQQRRSHYIIQSREYNAYPQEDEASSQSDYSREHDLKEAELDDDDDSKTQPDRLCCICLQRQKCVVLIPCRHLCLCEYCGDECVEDRITDCPLCREPIEQRLHVFL